MRKTRCIDANDYMRMLRSKIDIHDIKMKEDDLPDGYGYYDFEEDDIIDDEPLDDYGIDDVDYVDDLE